MVEGNKQGAAAATGANVGSGFLPGPEGPAGATLKRKQYEAEMAQLNEEAAGKQDATSAMSGMTDAQKTRACIDDLKVWIGKLGIDSSNLEELLV